MSFISLSRKRLPLGYSSVASKVPKSIGPKQFLPGRMRRRVLHSLWKGCRIHTGIPAQPPSSPLYSAQHLPSPIAKHKLIMLSNHCTSYTHIKLPQSLIMTCEYYVSFKNSKVIKLYNLHTLIKNLVSD